MRPKTLWAAYKLWCAGIRWRLALDIARFMRMVGAPL